MAQKTLSSPGKLLLISSSDMFHQDQEIPPCTRKNVKGGPGILLRIEMLMIDEENRRAQYEKELRRGSIYTLRNYYASNSKVMYHVADQRLVICISRASAQQKKMFQAVDLFD
uniref:Uncharacterized protein n=1 Tax=Brassica oleracea TaxID=3712 RepID=A0A3P6FPA7_BRAOL|nr:unnamed protein product [Brassica oleracea]